uniref:Uncharacterized protein n=1 Tax=Tanacetum cinerariifolium TaxID=118510 RepID=A0A6L2LWJ4_TANCI|nr:hypothetical protein [Tanacetum cinerariifolium]
MLCKYPMLTRMQDSVETLDNPFVAPVNIKIIESFMYTIGYQGVIDKVSAFYMKFLAQPWHGYAVSSLMDMAYWMSESDFMNYVSHKKDVIQYPRFTKLIIADLMEKFPSNPLRIEEDYHSIKDDISLELTNTVLLLPANTSKDPHKKIHISIKYSHLLGALRRMCRHQGYKISDMEKKCVTTDEFWKVQGKVDQVLHEIIPQLGERATNDLIEGNLKTVVADTVIQKRDAFQAENKKVNYHENNLMNSLITFIKSRVIWESVHDFQLGIESYQIKVNLTAPTLTFLGIEAHELYLIVDKPTTEATTDTELSSTEDIQPLAVQEPPHDSDIRQLIEEECCIEVPKEQKQKMEDTISDLVKICHQKEFLCMHDNVEDLIEGALDTKLLSINSIKSQRLDKKEQEVKNVEEQPAEQSTAKNLLPIPSECEVISENENECDLPTNDDSSQDFITFSNHIFNDDDDLYSSDNESLPEEDVLAEEFKAYSNGLFDNEEINSDKSDPHCLNGESDFVESLLNQVEKADFDFEEDIHFIKNLLYDNSSPRPPEDLNAEIADTIIESLPSSSIPVQDNEAREEIDLVTDTDELLPPPFENDNEEEEIEASDNLSIPHSLSESPNAKPDQENINDISDDSMNEPLLEEVNLFLTSDNSIPPGIEDFYDPQGDIRFLEALLIDDFIPFSVNESFDFEDDPLIPRPPPKPPDEETNSKVISAVVENIDEPNKSFDPGGEIFVSTNDEDVDYFVIRIFWPYLIRLEISPLFLSAESEDTMFDPGISD